MIVIMIYSNNNNNKRNNQNILGGAHCLDRDTRGGDGQGREGAEERGGGKNTKEKVSQPYQS